MEEIKEETQHGESSPHGENETPDKTEEDEPSKNEKSSLKDKPVVTKKSNRFHPYSKDKTANGDKKAYNRNRVFISNIPYDTKWQVIKDLMREKVGDVIYVELFKDAEGKSRGCGVVEFKTEDLVTKALDVMNKYDLGGRPLTIKEDTDGEHARRAMQRAGGGSYPGGPGLDISSPIVNLPPNLVNNPNIPPEVLTALQAGRLLPTVFVANLDFKVGWKKLKEVFSMAGTVKRADIKEDKDGKSRGIGTVIFEQPLEAVQAISMFNGQLLFDRPMHVKMDDRSVPHDDFRSVDKTPQLPRGLGGVGMGLGPGGQPIAANQMNMNSAMGSMTSGGVGIDGPAYGGMNRMGGGMSGPTGFSSGMDVMNNMGGFGGGNMGRLAGMGTIEDFRGNMAPGLGNMGGIGGNMGGMGSNMSAIGGMSNSVAAMGSSMGDIYRAGMASTGMGGSFDREFGRSDMAMNRGFGDSFGGMGGGIGGGIGGTMGGGMGTTGMGPMASALGAGMAAMNSMAGGMAMGMDRMGSSLDRMGTGMGVAIDRSMDMDRGFGSMNTGTMGSGLRDRGSGFRGCQIFARNLPYDLTWQKLKEKFSQCGHVMFAEIKMENGKSKGCGTVRFDSPEVAEKACRMMNGTKINGREIDVRMDRNA
ncbi:myelin expression factor 2 [Pristis pectinata]|uniref:myelin expression factor 2 n=1 Tax=Pristis pectinata TaxID=685728 RepID=UPI00223D470F|nr:myelin expression factor 2 [Pristis pectinata]